MILLEGKNFIQEDPNLKSFSELRVKEVVVVIVCNFLLVGDLLRDARRFLSWWQTACIGKLVSINIFTCIHVAMCHLVRALCRETEKDTP